MSAFGALCFEREVSCTLPAAGAHWELYRLLCWTQQFVLLAASGFVHRATSGISQSTPCCQLPCGADSKVREHCRRAALQDLVLPALAAKQAAAAAVHAACATARDTCAAAIEAFTRCKSITSSEARLALVLARST